MAHDGAAGLATSFGWYLRLNVAPELDAPLSERWRGRPPRGESRSHRCAEVAVAHVDRASRNLVGRTSIRNPIHAGESSIEYQRNRHPVGEDGRASGVARQRAVIECGVRFIDAADVYGPHPNETPIRDAPLPYPDDPVIATKGGFVRKDSTTQLLMPWAMHLRQSAHMSARRLGAEAIDLSYLHSGRAKSAPFLHQIGVLAELRQQHLVKHITLNRDQLQAWIAECREVDRTDASDTPRRIELITGCLMGILFVDLSQLVAKRLLQRAKRIDIREDDWIRVTRHLTLREFSQLAGADRDAVYATLRDFIDRGWIRVDDDSVIIADPSSPRHHLATAPTTDAQPSHPCRSKQDTCSHPLTPVGRYAIHIAPPFGMGCTVRMRLTSADEQPAWRATIYTAIGTPRTPRSVSNGTASRILDNG